MYLIIDFVKCNDFIFLKHIVCAVYKKINFCNIDIHIVNNPINIYIHFLFFKNTRSYEILHFLRLSLRPAWCVLRSFLPESVLKNCSWLSKLHTFKIFEI